MSITREPKLTVSLKSIGITSPVIHYQDTPDQLIEDTVENGMGFITDTGALAINTGKFTGRSPKDRFIVKDHVTKDKVWWGDINIPFSASKFDALYDKITHYLEDKEIYVRDAYACAEDAYHLPIRVVTEFPWSNMFAYNMFIRPSEAELDLMNPEWTVVCAPGFYADPAIDGTRQENFAILNFTKKKIIVGGTAYTGEIKKGIFSALNFLLPVYQDVLPMHCSANVGEDGDTAIFFGLSGTGKTTLSADASRKLVGDDEHGWTKENHVFNFEGGCYAKVIDLSAEKEPEIYGAIKRGAILENIVADENGRVDYTDGSITQNTRVSYPIDFIPNIQKPSISANPKNIFFLTADAFGVLPPISKLTSAQAAYHFMSGYTAKVAGTEAGVKEPQPSFSACFGAPFMPLHPSVYAEMLSDKMTKAGVNVWLVNTGWTGGPYGVGSRMKLPYTRRMINAVLNGELGAYDYDHYHIHTVFGTAIPRHIEGIPDEVLSPLQSWKGGKESYYESALKLAQAFRDNFRKFEANTSEEIRRGGPQRYDL